MTSVLVGGLWKALSGDARVVVAFSVKFKDMTNTKKENMSY